MLEPIADNPITSRQSKLNIVYGLLCGLLIFLYTWQPLQGNSDVFAHAAIGQWILQHRSIPHHTLFLWSQTNDWVAHSWLSEVGIYSLYSVFGSGGDVACVVATLVVISTTFLMVWRTRDQFDIPIALPILFCLGILSASVRFLPRPEVFTDLFTAIVLTRLIAMSRVGKESLSSNKGKNSPLSYLSWFCLFVLWTNLHGAVLQGLALIFLTLIGELVQLKSATAFKEKLILLAICSAALLVNPYGIHYLSIYTQIHSAVFRMIEEWSPLFATPMPSNAIIISLGVVVGCALMVILIDKPLVIGELLWWGFSLAAVLSSRRNIMLCTVVDLALICNHIGLLGRLEQSLKSKVASTNLGSSSILRGLPYVSQALLFVAIVANADFVTRSRPLELTRPDKLPINQVSFLEARHVEGKIFNDYNTSGYMEWRLHDHNTLFVDILNAYSDDIVGPWAQAMLGSPEGLHYLDNNGVNCVIGTGKVPGQPYFPPLYDRLSDSPQWSLAYDGRDGPIWIRKPGVLNLITH